MRPGRKDRSRNHITLQRVEAEDALHSLQGRLRDLEEVQLALQVRACVLAIMLRATQETADHLRSCGDAAAAGALEMQTAALRAQLGVAGAPVIAAASRQIESWLPHLGDGRSILRLESATPAEIEAVRAATAADLAARLRATLEPALAPARLLRSRARGAGGLQAPELADAQRAVERAGREVSRFQALAMAHNRAGHYRGFNLHRESLALCCGADDAPGDLWEGAMRALRLSREQALIFLDSQDLKFERLDRLHQDRVPLARALERAGAAAQAAAAGLRGPAAGGARRAGTDAGNPDGGGGGGGSGGGSGGGRGDSGSSNSAGQGGACPMEVSEGSGGRPNAQGGGGSGGASSGGASGGGGESSASRRVAAGASQTGGSEGGGGGCVPAPRELPLLEEEVVELLAESTELELALSGKQSYVNFAVLTDLQVGLIYALAYPFAINQRECTSALRHVMRLDPEDVPWARPPPGGAGGGGGPTGKRIVWRAAGLLPAGESQGEPRPGAA